MLRDPGPCSRETVILERFQKYNQRKKKKKKFGSREPHLQRKKLTRKSTSCRQMWRRFFATRCDNATDADLEKRLC
ncbi:hypothetical protein PUN28_009122 [Cardiocondyla obscurior]|uniref:Uncharacterized protein n=1 Tax=Cardiocondyla obscurior TaxID=286306 RepID=A0AAW2FSY8_9HYME